MATTYAPSHARYAISCHLMYAIPPWPSSKCRNTPNTNQLHVFAFQVGRSVLLTKDYCLNTSFSSSKIFRQGGNAWNLFDFDNQSAAIFCVDTIKYYSIPSVPSRLEGVKTPPDRVLIPALISFYRPKDDKEDLGPHAYTIRNSSYSFHARVHGDLSVSIRLAFPYECGSA